MFVWRRASGSGREQLESLRNDDGTVACPQPAVLTSAPVSAEVVGVTCQLFTPEPHM